MNLIDGAVDRDGAFLPAADASHPLPLGRADLGGHQVALGMRPEALRLVQPGAGQIVAPVDFIEELGASRVLHLHWAGQILAVMQTEPTPFVAGDMAGLEVPPEAVHLFSAETGIRLDEPARTTPAERSLATA